MADADIRMMQDSFEYTGEEIRPEFSVYYNNESLVEGTDYEVSYLNNIYSGTASVKIKGAGNYTGEAKKDFSIRRRSFDSAEFSAVVANQKYKKSQKEYKPIPIVTYGGEILLEGADYTLQYANNTDVTTDSASAVVVITGVNNYEGSKELKFDILKEALDTKKLKVVVKEKSYDYDGQMKEPDVVVTYKGKTLTENEDYVVTYQNNVNAGKAAVVVSGMGEYAGSKAVSFTIKPRKLSNSEKYTVSYIQPEEYNGANCPTPSVVDMSLNKELATSDLAYSYKNNKKAGNATVIIKGIGNYTGSISKNFEIMKLSFDSYEYSIDDCAYIGNKVTPDIIATSKSTGERITLKTGVACKVKFTNNVEVGNEAKAVITPKNKKFFTIKEGDTGKREVTFKIVKCNLEDVTISPVKNQKYNKGRELKPKLVVKCGTAKMKLNKQYKIIYADNKEKGYGTATIIPADETHFTGSQTIKFVIK